MVSASKKIDPAVVLHNYKLIYHFLTTPICKDPSIIAKIIHMLTENMQSTQIFNFSEMVYYERILTELHFKKLVLFSKIVISCFAEEKFTRYETNSKRIFDSKMKGAY